ncbi:MAG: hypothetical protein LBR07_07955 [Puniceicoccales bacterium]|jgi:sirohydrochlorin ferrochelatase|nr:hypothetical protein [Puniceicoccales bacterium]
MVPAVVLLLDHGSTNPAAGEARETLAGKLAALLPPATRVIPCSLKEPGAPTLAETLARPDLRGADVAILPLFLFPGRHAGTGGDIARIAAAAAGSGGENPPKIRIAPFFSADPDFPALLAKTLRQTP